MNKQNNEMTVENAAAEIELDDLSLTAAQDNNIKAGRADYYLKVEGIDGESTDDRHK